MLVGAELLSDEEAMPSEIRTQLMREMGTKKERNRIQQMFHLREVRSKVRDVEG